MKKFFRKYLDAVLAILALLFLGILFSSFSWGIGRVIQEVDRGMNAGGAAGGNAGFNLTGAKALNLRGLVK